MEDKAKEKIWLYLHPHKVNWWEWIVDEQWYWKRSILRMQKTFIPRRNSHGAEDKTKPRPISLYMFIVLSQVGDLSDWSITPSLAWPPPPLPLNCLEDFNQVWKKKLQAISQRKQEGKKSQTKPRPTQSWVRCFASVWSASEESCFILGSLWNSPTAGWLTLSLALSKCHLC